MAWSDEYPDLDPLDQIDPSLNKLGSTPSFFNEMGSDEIDDFYEDLPDKED